VVTPSGKAGTAKAIDLYYEAGGRHYLLLLPQGLKIRVGRRGTVAGTALRVTSRPSPGRCITWSRQ
jgi:hypothetical protein